MSVENLDNRVDFFGGLDALIQKGGKVARLALEKIQEIAIKENQERGIPHANDN